MKKHIIFLCLLLTSILAIAQDGRLQDTRINVSIGLFSAGGTADYQGAVGGVGSTGYSVDDIAVGDLLVDDTNIYEIEAVNVTVAGSIATLDVSYLQGTVGTAQAPISGKGAIVKPTANLKLLLLTENGSNFITEEQEAKILTHNFLKIDQAINAGSSPEWRDAGNGVMVFSDEDITTAKSGGVVTLSVGTAHLYAYRVVGGASDLNSGELRIVINGGAGAGTNYNTSNADLIHPTTTIQNRTQVLPTDPFLQRPDDAGDSINIFDEPFATSGQVAVKVTGLSGDFAIKGNF